MCVPEGPNAMSHRAAVHDAKAIIHVRSSDKTLGKLFVEKRLCWFAECIV